MARYSTERKQNILSKLLPPLSMSVAEVAAQEGISTATIYYWKQQAQKRGEPVPGKTSTTEQWSAETMLATVMATATLNETEGKPDRHRVNQISIWVFVSEHKGGIHDSTAQASHRRADFRENSR